MTYYNTSLLAWFNIGDCLIIPSCVPTYILYLEE
uniref:Uncharacterized protein n=1 Tax=Anguilla anguilla TaxID=7936 RepID=A0A0E9VU76_ANGAN